MPPPPPCLLPPPPSITSRQTRRGGLCLDGGAGAELEEGGGPSVKRRAGDWDCPSCGALVWATKDQCFRCHAAKPKDTDESSGGAAQGTEAAAAAREAALAAAEAELAKKVKAEEEALAARAARAAREAALDSGDTLDLRYVMRSRQAVSLALSNLMCVCLNPQAKSRAACQTQTHSPSVGERLECLLARGACADSVSPCEGRDLSEADDGFLNLLDEIEKVAVDRKGEKQNEGEADVKKGGTGDDRGESSDAEGREKPNQRLDWVLVRLGRKYPDHVVKWLVARVMLSETGDQEGGVVNAGGWSRMPAARVLDLLSQLRPAATDAAVLEALELLRFPATEDAGQKEMKLCGKAGGMLAKLIRLVEECPRLVSSCSQVVVRKLCSQDFFHGACLVNMGGTKTADVAGEGTQLSDTVQSLISLFIQRAPLLKVFVSMFPCFLLPWCRNVKVSGANLTCVFQRRLISSLHYV